MARPSPSAIRFSACRLRHVVQQRAAGLKEAQVSAPAPAGTARVDADCAGAGVARTTMSPAAKYVLGG
jgi:hypothetical protein